MDYGCLVLTKGVISVKLGEHYRASIVNWEKYQLRSEGMTEAGDGKRR